MRESFDIGEDIRHQRKVWTVERVAWVLMSAAIIAALCGFTGHGLFSARTATSPESGLVIEYQRFERHHAQTHLSLMLTGTPAEETQLYFGAEFLRKAEVTRIEPEPERAELGADATMYVFNTNAAGRIIVHYRPIAMGRVQLVLSRDTAPPLRLTQYVYP
jgi:hypothetical protein